MDSAAATTAKKICETADAKWKHFTVRTSDTTARLQQTEEGCETPTNICNELPHALQSSRLLSEHNIHVFFVELIQMVMYVHLYLLLPPTMHLNHIFISV